MKKSVAAAALVLVAGQALGQWSDDFNRESFRDLWKLNTGTLGNFFIENNVGAHEKLRTDVVTHLSASAPYQAWSQTIDLRPVTGGLRHVALGCGYGAGNNLYLKLEATGDSGFSSIGFYSGVNSSAGWTGAAPTSAPLSSVFAEGRVQVRFTEGGNKVNVVVDTDYDGIPDQSYERSGVRSFMAGSGTGFGIGAYSVVRFDNWRVMPTIVPPGASNGALPLPFGVNFKGAVHQVFRSGLWPTPVRITGVRYAPQSLGTWTGDVSINLGYTSRVPGVLPPAGLSVPRQIGAGYPNAVGPLTVFYNNPAFSQTFFGGVAPNAENFQMTFNSTPGFVYFPGVGNLLMETNTTVGSSTLDLLVSRRSNGPDSSMAYSTNLYGDGNGVTDNLTPLVQIMAMPYTPDVLPTWVHVGESPIPFRQGQALTHQVHHAGTIAPLGVEGGGKVAIQGLGYAPTSNVNPLKGQVTVRMGYSSRVPGEVPPVGVDIPAAGGGGAPNASGALQLFMDRTMNVTFPSLDAQNFQLQLHQRPFVYDPAQGNLLIETESTLLWSVPVSITLASPEAMRAYRSTMGNVSDTGETTRVKFLTTPVVERVYPAHVADGPMNVPFYTGTHVTHQVFDASQFGAKPVRIDSMAYSARDLGSLSSNVTVRMGYTSRVPNANPPAGLSVPDFGGEGAPNVSFGPMAVFRSGPLPVNVLSVDPNTYQIVMKGDEPFLYNPALGNLLVEVVSNATQAILINSWNNAAYGSSIAVNSTAFGADVYPSFAPLVKFGYFDDLYPCVADMNGDATVDLVDFFAFLGCFDLTSQCADVDGVPGVDLGDFFAFLGSWDEGC